MNVKDIESAILQLPRSELEGFAAWFEQFLADEWDKQIEEDLQAGRFDPFIQQVKREIEAGEIKPL